MKELLQKISEISKKHEQLNRISGNNFNVFNIINVTSNEVRLHSRFIAELLNPKGTHGQKELFLELFTEQLKIDIDCKTAVVEIEKYIGVKTETNGGYIDIFISDSQGNSIIIENKIYAIDQENQLLRYCNCNFNHNNVLYLTLFGDAPDEKSYKPLKIDEHFSLISYKNDIIDWLVTCRKEAVELPLLREGISHYINLLKILTGQNFTSKMNTEIANYITSNTNNLRQAVLIEENMNTVKIQIQWAFWESLKKEMTSLGLEPIPEMSVSKENVESYYNKSRNRDKHFGFRVKIKQMDHISIYFGIELQDNIYFGFIIEKEGKSGISDLEEKITGLIKGLNSNYKNEKYWLGWRYSKKMLNFRAFNSEAIFELANEDLLAETVKEIIDDFKDDIKNLKTKLEKSE